MIGRAVQRALIILLISAAVVVGALLLAQDQETLRVKSIHGVEDRPHPPYLAALVGADLTRGNRYEVLTNGDQIFPPMLAAIDAAKRRISFETYIYSAARSGVKVTIVADSVGAISIGSTHEQRLRSAGAKLYYFNPPRWYSLEEVNYRTHRKILVIDGDVAFTGGVGVADHWLGNAQDADHWRDTQVKIEGPIVRLLEAVFYEDLVESASDEAVTPELDDDATVLDESGASMLVRSSPTGGASDLKRLYLLIVAGARKTLDIETPYFVPDESTMWSLEDAVRRGVRVRILVEGDITDAMPVKYASRASYDKLLSLGISIYEYAPTMMHSKVLVADGALSMFGSANFDNRSLELNEELNVTVSSRELAARFLSDFEQDVKASRKLELDAWRRRPFLDKTRERFWSGFAEIF